MLEEVGVGVAVGSLERLGDGAGVTVALCCDVGASESTTSA